MISIAFRHALRVSELVALRWDQADLAQGRLHVRRRKNGNPSTHPLHGPELRALRRLQRDYPNSPYIFTGERKGPLTDSTVRKMVARAGTVARLEFPVHPHMLRHAQGTSWRTTGRTLEPSSITSATKTSVTRFDTPNCRRSVSKTSGRIELVYYFSNPALL
jgi:type 1 fimbriae regulatory protein FimB/type 1 fimbriae regulatory protein FimE